MIKTTILFICTENAGRSQMAEGFAKFYGVDTITAYSAGSTPAAQINPRAVEAMKEKNIDISAKQPKGLADFANIHIDYAVTMGCGDTCPCLPGTKTIEWGLADPKGQPLEKIKPIRDKIEQQVIELLKAIK